MDERSGGGGLSIYTHTVRVRIKTRSPECTTARQRPVKPKKTWKKGIHLTLNITGHLFPRIKVTKKSNA